MIKRIPLLLAILGLVFLSACGDDEPIDIINPDLAIIDDNNVDGSIVSSGDTLIVTIEAIAGTNELNSLTILENGERLPNFEERLFLDGSIAPSNLLLLQADSRQEFATEVGIVAPDMAGNYEVEIVVADEEENSSTVSFSYFVSDITTLEGVLLNQGGPAGTGGLDLDTGVGTGSQDPDAEIRDLGIDTDSIPSKNWLQRIAPITDNDVELATLSSEFDFDAVFTQAQVAEAFDPANTVAESDVVEVGDMFAVRTADDRSFILLVTDITITEAMGDNTDNYTFTIKQGQ